MMSITPSPSGALLAPPSAIETPAPASLDPSELLRRALEHLVATGTARTGGLEAERADGVPLDASTTASAGVARTPGALFRGPDDSELREVASAFALRSDPVLTLLGITESLRGQESVDQRDRVRTNTRSSQVANREQRIARQRAERASRRARRWLAHAPRWVKRLVSAVISAAGLVSAAFSGGASLALAIAGTALLLSAEHIAKAATELGLSGKGARILCAALQIAGAALSGASGAASGPSAIAAAAGQQATAAVRTAEQVVSAVQGALTAVRGARGVGVAVFTHQAAEADLDAERSARAVEAAHADTSDVLDAMRRSSSAFEGASERLVDIAEVRRRRDDAIAAGIGR